MVHQSKRLKGSAMDREVRRFFLAVGVHAVLAAFLDGIDQDTLRAAERPNRLQPAFTNAVIDRPARHAEQLRGMVERDTAADTGLTTLFSDVFDQLGRVRGQSHFISPYGCASP